MADDVPMLFTRMSDIVAIHEPLYVCSGLLSLFQEYRDAKRPFTTIHRVALGNDVVWATNTGYYGSSFNTVNRWVESTMRQVKSPKGTYNAWLSLAVRRGDEYYSIFMLRHGLHVRMEDFLRVLRRGSRSTSEIARTVAFECPHTPAQRPADFAAAAHVPVRVGSVGDVDGAITACLDQAPVAAPPKRLRDEPPAAVAVTGVAASSLSPSDRLLLQTIWYPTMQNYMAPCIQCETTMLNFGSTNAFVAAHVVSRAHGGTSEIGNLIPECAACNQTRPGADATRNQLDTLMYSFTSTKKRNYKIIEIVTKLRIANARQVRRHPGFSLDLSLANFARAVFGTGPGALTETTIYDVLTQYTLAERQLKHVRARISDTNAEREALLMKLRANEQANWKNIREMSDIERANSAVCDAMSEEEAYTYVYDKNKFDDDE